jgi:hypothetical protein
VPKAEIRLTAEQWAICKSAVGRAGVPSDETSQHRQSRLYAWLQFTHEEQAQVDSEGQGAIIMRHMAGGMKRRLVAIVSDVTFQGWRQESWVSIVLPALAGLGWLPEYDDEDEDDE